MLRKALIQFDEGSQTSGIVTSVMEVSERGFGGVRAAENQTIWDCTNWNVQPDDVWRDGIFYKASEPNTQVDYIPTVEEKVAINEQSTRNVEDTIKVLMDCVVQMQNGGTL